MNKSTSYKSKILLVREYLYKIRPYLRDIGFIVALLFLSNKDNLVAVVNCYC